MSTLKSNNEDMTINADGASSEIILQQNGTERIRIDSSGNVGIGDTTPTNAKLSIDNVLAGDAALAVKQDQTDYGIDIDQNGNNIAFHIDTAATTQPAIEVEANALTTGKGMLISSNSADTSTRQLLRVTNDNTSATSTTCLYLQQDSTGATAEFRGNGGHVWVTFNSGNMTLADDAVYTVPHSPANTGALVAVGSRHRANQSVTYPHGLFMGSYAESSTVLIADSQGTFAASDTDGKICCYSSTSNVALYVKNRIGISTLITIAVQRFAGN